MTPTDWLLESLAVIVMAYFISTILNAHDTLPETIPTHFNHKGEADGYSNKSTLWLLPSIAMVTYIGMILINRSPHRFNYPVEITEHNATYQYRLASRLIRVVNIAIVLTFYIITREMILTAQNASGQIGTFLFPSILLITLVPIIIYLIIAFRHKS